MALLPQFQNDDTAFQMMQNVWAAQLNPVLSNPLNGVQILKDVKLAVGDTVINHLLGRVQQGYFFVDQQGPSTIYRNAPFNKLTLTLNSSAAVTVSIGVF